MNFFIANVRTLLTTALLCATASLTAFAGSETGNGDDVVLLPSGGTHVVDAYTRLQPPILPRPSDERMTLTKELRLELAKAAHLFVRYRAAASYSGKIWESSDFVDQYILSANAKFYLTEELPCHDAESAQEAGIGDTLTGAAAGLKKIPVACTDGENTWIVKSLLAQLPIREQAVLLVHERMHALPESPSHLRIFGVTRGLYVALGLFDEQAHGARPMLAPEQVEALTGMLRSLAYLNGGKTAYARTGARIAVNGGGVVLLTAEKDIAPDSYLGVGSVLSYGSVASGAELINSTCMGCVLGEIAILKNFVAGVNNNAEFSTCLENDHPIDPKHEYCRLPLARFSFGADFRGSDSYLTRKIRTGYKDEVLADIRFGAGARVSDTRILGIPLGSSFGNGSQLVSISLNAMHRFSTGGNYWIWENQDAAPVLLVGRNTILRNAAGTLILEGFHSGPIALGSRPELRLVDGAVFDFADESICPFESLPGLPYYDGGYAKISGKRSVKSAAEFQRKLCELQKR